MRTPSDGTEFLEIVGLVEPDVRVIKAKNLCDFSDLSDLQRRLRAKPAGRYRGGVSINDTEAVAAGLKRKHSSAVTHGEKPFFVMNRPTAQ